MKKLFWKNWIVLLLGFVVLLMPFMGFPTKINNWIYAISGALIVILAYIIGRGLSYAYSAPVKSEEVQTSDSIRRPSVVCRPIKKRNPEPRVIEEINPEELESASIIPKVDSINMNEPAEDVSVVEDLQSDRNQ